jgi:hypothetical protein
MQAKNEVRRRPHSHQHKVCAIAGFAVPITFQFHYLHLSCGTGRNWSGLTFRFTPLLSPPIPATSQTQTLAVMPQVEQKTKNNFLNKISHYGNFYLPLAKD